MITVTTVRYQGDSLTDTFSANMEVQPVQTVYSGTIASTQKKKTNQYSSRTT